MEIHGGRRKDEETVVGDVRKSQLITTFGIGSMVDFVHQTVMICGTDDWPTDEGHRIRNRNLENLLRVRYFVSPRHSEKRRGPDGRVASNPDIRATVFPRKLYSPVCNRIVDVDDAYYDRKSGEYRCRCEKCQKKTRLLPSSFVLICPAGHIEDFPYSWWVHRGGKCPDGDGSFITMRAYNNRTDLDNLYLECSCGASRSMGAIGNRDAFAGYRCSGSMPWLGVSEECRAYESGEYMRMRRRSETSVHFPVVVSALTVPPWDTKLCREVQNAVTELTEDGKIDDVGLDYHVRRLTRKFSDTGATEDYVRDLFRKTISGSRDGATMADIMQDEYRAITSSGRDPESEDFVLREQPVPGEYSHLIDRVIAAEKLTVVTAMVGFSMLSPQSYDSDRLCRVSRNRKQAWYPGVEQKGEGIFIQFNRKKLDEWAEERGGWYDEMRENLGGSSVSGDNFSAQFVFLHTFAHLLIRELSSACGYSTASIRERIYSTYEGSDYGMCGVLVYTSTPDADGSLGGLVEQAEPQNLGQTISSLVERGKWCSADPVCGMSKGQGYKSLNYAACFACTLLPETSCEYFNGLLDRCAVCGKPDDPGFGFMNRGRER